MTRAFILIMDSFGIGAAPDANRFGDSGANTLGHIAEACARGQADRNSLRRGPLHLPNLIRLGLGEAAAIASGHVPANLTSPHPLTGAYGAAFEHSLGKDTPSGHWEIAGCPVPFEWGYFPDKRPAFPPELIAELVKTCDLPGILGDCHASGTTIIEELGEEHIRTGKPICYTSADSVFQIAAHQEHFGLERLYHVCEIAKRIFERINIARVIARPFLGNHAGAFNRTPKRRDLTTPPPGPTLLDSQIAAGQDVIAIGKIADIFAHRGISQSIKADDNASLFQRTLEAADTAADGSLIFTNFVDFDTLFGHRRDIAGYAAALEAFDRDLPRLEVKLRPNDLVLISADHGCDPTWKGSDHTREFVPVLFFGPNVKPINLGQRDGFADMGQTVAAHLGLAPLKHGRNCFT